MQLKITLAQLTVQWVMYGSDKYYFHRTWCIAVGERNVREAAIATSQILRFWEMGNGFCATSWITDNAKVYTFNLEIFKGLRMRLE